jgi:hypothetical protein
VDTQIDDYLRRPGRYDNIDGLIEVTWGVLLLGLGFWAWMASITLRGSFFHHWYNMTAFVALVVAGTHFGRQFVKRRVTYARTGFVVPIKCASRWLAIGVAFGTAVGTSVAMVALMKHSGPATEAIVLWLGNALFYAVVAKLDQAWKAGVLFVMTFGLLAVVLVSPGETATELFCLLFFGLCWVASGSITFGLYLRHSHPPEPVE